MNPEQPKQQGNFFILGEQKPFSIGNMPSSEHSRLSARSWIRELDPDANIKLKSIRSQVFQLLNVKSFEGIQQLIDNPKLREEVSDRAYALLGKMYGIEGTENEIISKINGYAGTANAVINYLKDGVLSHYALRLEMINEVSIKNNPVDLLLIVFNGKYSPKARFEAKRKLVLMNLAASIDQRERETQSVKKFDEFLDFLNQNVWSPDAKIGETQATCILSDHDPKTFACVSFKILTPEDARKVQPEPNQKLTWLDRRTFQTDSGKRIPIYVTTRNKPQVLRILKLLRKGMENPAVAVDDELGLLGVLNSVLDVNLFQKQLTQSAVKAGSLMTLEEVSDTLNGGRHRTETIGSSPDVRMRKFFAKLGGMRVEFILHTNDTYLDYLFRDVLSHEEYEIKRLIDTGITTLLFPGIEMDRALIIQQVRKKIREN